MPLAATEPEIKAAILAVVQGSATGRVWPRLRIAETDAQFKEWYVTSEGIGDVWFVRRTSVNSIVDGIPPSTISDTHTYELLYFRARVDNDDNALASETLFQEQIELVRAAFAADFNLGLDAGVTHGGFYIAESIPRSATLGVYEGHLCSARLVVVVAEC